MYIKKNTIYLKQPKKLLYRKKKLYMSLLVGQCLQDVHLIKEKINLIIIEEKILKESTMEIINHKEKELIPLTHEEDNFYNEQEVCYICKEKFSIIIHNASYDTHFILEQFAKEFKGELNCIGVYMEKYITFSVPWKNISLFLSQLKKS